MSKKESPRTTLLPEPPPHPSKFARTKQTWIIVGVTGAFCLLLIGLLYSLSDRTPTQSTIAKSDDVINLLEAPSKHVVDVVDISSSDVGVTLRAGGWIQQTDSNGNLAQQYRCTALDPSPANMPPGWIEMTDPDVELYLSSNRVVRIRGNIAMANAPKRALESGDIYGDVRIELFEGEHIDTQTDTPLVVMTTPQASFDNFLGEVVCPSEVRIVASNRSSLIGRNLSLRFNDTNGRIEYLRLEEVDAITIYQTDQQAKHSALSPALRSKKSQTKSTYNHRVSAGALLNDEQYYLLELFDHVIIKQGDLMTGKEGRGNRMTIAFALGSTNTTQTSISKQTSPLSLEALLIASLFAVTDELPNQHDDVIILPEQEQEPVIITCDGGLTMLPLDNVEFMPSIPEETRLEIFGTPAILIDHQANISARASKVRYEVDQDRMDLFGSTESQAIVTMKNTTAYANHLWFAQKVGVGQIVGEGLVEQTDDTTVKTTITWQGGVDFTMTPSNNESDGGVLEQVICKDQVVIKTEESTLTCDTLDIRFSPDGDGSSSPELAIATGNVKGISDTQTLWADKAEVTFVAVDVAETDEPDSFSGTLQADKMKATGDVQVLLNDGGRAFCNTLRGDLNQSIAELEGNVLIAYKRMLMDRGDDALFRINRTTGKGLWEGPGQARFLTQPIQVSGDSRMPRPVLHIDSQDSINDPEAQHVSMRTTWEDSMAIDQHFNNGAGLVDFRGSVVARSRQSSVELTEIHSESLQLEFTNVPLPEDLEQNNERRLQRIIARDNATFEHRLNAENPNVLPVVYYISGNHIEYETDTSELVAVGNGLLLIRDNRQPLQTTHQSSLAGRGVTTFTWDGHLRTVQITKELYRINMTDNVQMLHKGLDNTVGMLTSNTMKALSRNASVTDKSDASAVALRGMDVQEIQAEGNVYVSTATRRVDCDLFDYNLRTGLAKLSALPGRTVAIVTEGTPYPVRASSILWNMDPGIDSITIKGLQGTSTN